jgi:hypothetical protein
MVARLRRATDSSTKRHVSVGVTCGEVKLQRGALDRCRPGRPGCTGTVRPMFRGAAERGAVRGCHFSAPRTPVGVGDES